MEIFNIGPLELIIVIIIMFVLLGPKEMILTANRIGRWVRTIIRSPMWREIMGYSQEIRELPKKLMDDTGLDEALKEVNQSTQMAVNDLNTTVNEAVQAARVPEAEHVRIQTTPVTASKTAGSSQPVNKTEQKSTGESSILPPITEGKAEEGAEQQLVEESSSTIAPEISKPKKSSKKSVTEDPAGEETKPKTRKKKATAVLEEQETPVHEEVIAEQTGEIVPVAEVPAPDQAVVEKSKPRRKTKTKVEVAEEEISPPDVLVDQGATTNETPVQVPEINNSSIPNKETITNEGEANSEPLAAPQKARRRKTVDHPSEMPKSEVIEENVEPVISIESPDNGSTTSMLVEDQPDLVTNPKPKRSRTKQLQTENNNGSESPVINE
jgi:Sec-independent protein translocase protein TatA